MTKCSYLCSVQHIKTIGVGEACILCEHFLCLYFKILRYIVPPCGTVIEPQHQWYVLNSGKDNIPFLFIVMFNNTINRHQTNNSSLMATLIHDTDRMSSLEIAELTGKRHDAILRDIRNLLRQGVSAHNFVETSYKDKSNRQSPCFKLTKKGCLILASGYNAVLREKIIDRWEQLELEKRKPQTPQTYLEALKALVSSEEEKQRLAQEKKILEEKNAKLQPKAAFSDCIMQSNDCISVGEMANILKQNGLFKRGRNALYEWMRWNGYLLSRGARYNLPSQKSMSLGIMKIAESIKSVREQVFINRKAVITPHGQKFFIKTFSKGKSLGQGAIRFTYQ